MWSEIQKDRKDERGLKYEFEYQIEDFIFDPGGNGQPLEFIE